VPSGDRLGVQGFYLSLPDRALDQLRQIAERTRRTPRDEAAILLQDAIERRATELIGAHDNEEAAPRRLPASSAPE
jgi:hypothetical protein